MANKENQSQRFIYIRSLKEKVPCTEQQFQEFYREATRIRKKELLRLKKSNSGAIQTRVASLIS